MLRDNPEINAEIIAGCLTVAYGFQPTSLTYLPIGYDLNAYVYEAVSDDGTSYFVKIRSGNVYEPALDVPRALNDHGVRNVLAPLLTQSGQLWCWLDDDREQSVMVYPFIRGTDAVENGLTDDQWRTFGATLRAVHESGLAEQFRDQLQTETFTLPSAAKVREILALVQASEFEGEAASRFAAFLRSSVDRIERTLARAADIGRTLQTRTFELVLCHADTHAANIFVEDAGDIWLVDWDGPLIAPRERDLLFVIGSEIARTVTPREEDLFFETYGPMEIDPTALIYYRYERMIEDIGEIGHSVLIEPYLSEQVREEAAALARDFYLTPGNYLDRVENVHRLRWP
jgi:spectinomycin phosphotransferase